MEYFYISQDKRYKNPPSIVNFYDRFYPNLFCVEQEHRIPDKNVVYIGSGEKTDYLDIVAGPVILVSERMKRIMEPYEDLVWKMMFLLNIPTGEGEVYYTPIMKKTDCVKIIKIQGCRHMIFKKDMEGDGNIWKSDKEELRGGIVINMMVAESLLRRNLKGICYERLEVE